jgi:hypothetical protein
MTETLKITGADIDRAPALTAALAARFTATIELPAMIHKAAAKDHTRYAISGAYIVSGGGVVKAYATNGRILAAVDCSTSGADSMPQGVALVPAAALPRQKTRRALRLNVQGGAVVSALDTHGDTLPLDDGRFPPLVDVLPKVDVIAPHGDAQTVTLSVPLLRDLLAAITDDRASSRDADGNPASVTFMLTAPNKPVVLLGNAGLGIIMPITAPEYPREVADKYAARRAAIVANIEGAE